MKSEKQVQQWLAEHEQAHAGAVGIGRECYMIETLATGLLWTAEVKA